MIGVSAHDCRSRRTPVLMTFRGVLGLTVMRRVWFAQIVSLLGDFLALFAVLSVVTSHAWTATQVTGVSIAYDAVALLGPLRACS